MGAMGALLTPAPGIRDWVDEFRAGSRGAFQLNLWMVLGAIVALVVLWWLVRYVRAGRADRERQGNHQPR